VDVVAGDDSSLSSLVDALEGAFELSVSLERRTISIPAPNDTLDLTTVTSAVRKSGIAVEELALRRPTLDDAFLSLTTSGSPDVRATGTDSNDPMEAA
jgi:hypothetical protein